jgi:transcriptional regulator with XRE-family HTH domain
MSDFPADRYIRAARAIADLSQRELAMRAGVPHHVVAKTEHAPRYARVDHFACLLEAAGLHLIVVDDEGREVQPEGVEETKRVDRGRRRFPPHLDVREGKEDWWGDGWPMFAGKTPQYTFDRSRGYRDWRRERKAREVERTKQARGELTGGELTGGELTGGELTGGELTGGELTGGELASDKVRGDEFGDLHGVECGALAEVVVAYEQGEPAKTVDPGVLSHPSDEAGVGSSGLQRGGDRGQLNARGVGEQLQSPRDGQGP